MNNKHYFASVTVGAVALCSVVSLNFCSVFNDLADNVRRFNNGLSHSHGAVKSQIELSSNDNPQISYFSETTDLSNAEPSNAAVATSSEDVDVFTEFALETRNSDEYIEKLLEDDPELLECEEKPQYLAPEIFGLEDDSFTANVHLHHDDHDHEIYDEDDPACDFGKAIAMLDFMYNFVRLGDDPYGGLSQQYIDGIQDSL